MRTHQDVIVRHKIIAIAALAISGLLVGPVSGASAASTSPAIVNHAVSTVVSLDATSTATTLVPKVVGKTAYAAKTTLVKAGLFYAYKAPTGSFVVLSKNWTVTKQSPKAKSKVKPGTTIKLTVVKTSTLVGGSSAGSSAPVVPVGPTLTVSQQQAVIAAKGYLTIGGFSYQGLIDQLSSSYGNGFSAADATSAVDSLNADYNAQAVIAAKGYLSIGGFSHASMVEQLSSPYGNKFTPEQAEYATTQVGL